ncbi:hypothetical protein C2I18_22135 [Paenibacillus sp. PK3_47]|uniref:phosphotransferase enzyme family protein n=1 Tax=Paenibacillus sp. PK3_47 TaxID=2072642 RepID=UPI00201DC593|nr:phosphotransferase [Paenibacillus sp. PK3_47]UQZ35992.1 hypothetical protein C2I18_22135 [Paenibacillus sp. PK3_47]
MLKLKYLFNNPDLAEMLLKNWEYDPESLGMFRHYRISSNAVYPFQAGGHTQLLRFAPQSEKLKNNLLAELEFITYLKTCGYGVLESVPASGGAELVEAQTPWGDYYASVFKKVAGKQLSSIGLSDRVVYKYGEALGQLHQLSRSYELKGGKRWSHRDVLEWIKDVLAEFPLEHAARAEADLLADYFNGLSVAPDNYGLIHYDFEKDNVFYDEATGTINVIDFDDSMYHWYAADIGQALDSLLEDVATDEQEVMKSSFLEGYRSKYTLSETGPSPEACRRFANLYGYARIIRSTAERWEHEPEWLAGLRVRLEHAMKEKASGFGEPL